MPWHTIVCKVSTVALFITHGCMQVIASCTRHGWATTGFNKL